MNNSSQTKTCQNCKKEFEVTTDDASFYQKIKVPVPTHFIIQKYIK